MKTSTSSWIKSIVLITTLLVPSVVISADWPSRPISMIIMSKEGGGMDRASRLIGDAMASRLGQPMKYVNRPGASGEIALKSFLNAKQDGYTIFSGNIPTIMLMYGSADKDYNITAELAWLGGYLIDPGLLVTSSDSSITSLGDFIEKAQTSPQRVGIANWSSVQTLALLQLQQQANLQLEIIPYSGFKKASTALLGNHIEAAVGNFSATQKLGDQIRELAIFADKAPGDATDVESVKTLAKVDVIDAASIRAVAVHKGLKTAYPERHQRLSAVFQEVISDPVFINDFSTIGADPAQSIAWNETDADQAAEGILTIIDEFGDVFVKAK